MAQKDPDAIKLPTERRPTSSNVAKGPDEDWVHVVPSEPVCRNLSASSCYVVLPGPKVDDDDGAVADGEKAEYPVEMDAKEVSPTKSDASDTADAGAADDAACNGMGAGRPVEANDEKVSPKDKCASNTTEHVVPPTGFNLILMQSKSPILHLLSAKLVDRAEGQRPSHDHDSDVD